MASRRTTGYIVLAVLGVIVAVLAVLVAQAKPGGALSRIALKARGYIAKVPVVGAMLAPGAVAAPGLTTQAPTTLR